MSITEELRQRLTAKVDSGESLLAVAKFTSIDYSTLHRFFHGKGSLGGKNVDKLARHFGLKLCEEPQAGDKPAKKK